MVMSSKFLTNKENPTKSFEDLAWGCWKIFFRKYQIKVCSGSMNDKYFFIFETIFYKNLDLCYDVIINKKQGI